MKQNDLIVIGTGSGLDVAVAAAGSGLKIALFEKEKMGGTCLNRGCIPSKMLIHSADIIEIIKKSSMFGIKAKITKIDFPSIIKRVSDFVDEDSKGIERAYSENTNPALFKGTVRFIGMKTLQLKNETFKADKILIATGARPTIPEIEGLDKVDYITSTEALRLTKQPRELTILGGGYIAAELAHFYGSLGTKINIVQRSSWLLTKEDEEIAKKYTESVSKKFNLFLNYDIVKVSEKNKKFFTVIKDQKTNKAKTLKSDQLLIVLGVTPNSDILDLGKTNVNVDDKGFIITNEYMETNASGIFALGDAVGKYMFKHNANWEAEYILNNILNPNNKKKVDYTAMPHAIFTSPQIAGVGYTEQELKEKNIPYSIGKHKYIYTGMGKAIEDTEGFVKILVDKNTKKILGCHILGTDASALIHEVLIAMKSGSGKIDDIINTVHIHPALSEVVQRAGFNIN